MKSRLKFNDLTWPGRAVFIMGLTLAPAAFWFPRESLLHGAGGGIIGILFIFFSLSSRSNWLLATCSVAATFFCIVGGSGYFRPSNGGNLLSIIGAVFALCALSVYLANKSRTLKATKA
jgi:hypothetical protein